jgi:serine phosphatase RsbU (regulator of sigma subunit)
VNRGIPAHNAQVHAASLRARPSTSVRGTMCLFIRLIWGLISVLTFLLAASAFVEILGHDSLNELFRVGAFSLENAIVRGLTDAGLSRDLLIQIDIAFRLMGFLAFSVTGAFMFLRRSDDWMTALSSLMLITVGASWFAPVGALEGENWLRLAHFIGATEPWSPEFGRSVAGVSLLLFTFLFPDGRFVPHWMRWVAGVVVTHVLLWSLTPGSIFDVGTWPTSGQAVWIGTLIAASLFAQIYRLVVADRNERQQTQLVVGALCVIAVTPALLFLVNPELGGGLPALTIRTPELEALYSVIVLLFLAAALLMLPVSIAVSILRYRLWDFDIIVNRTLVYGMLTAILGAGYFAIVAVVSSFVGRSYVTVATATMLVAVLFQPLRKRLQNEVDRRFYRSKYDAAHTLNEFSARLRHEIDLEPLAREVLKVVQDAMHPRHVSLWVVEAPDSRNLSIYSPARPRGRSGSFHLDPEDAAVDVFRASPGARPLDEAIFDSQLLSQLREEGVDVTVPLVSQGGFIGLVNLGPRLSGRAYSSDDLRLLDGLADHTAPAVRVALLVRRHESELRDRERVDNEMHVAQLIQQQFLPKQLPDLPGFEIDASYRAARAVGGDFYDFIDLPGGQLALVIGDVTGKGVPAALVMATTRSVLRSEAPRLIEPGLVLASINDQVLNDTPSSMFATCLYVVLDPGSGSIRFANAGHNLPYLQTDEGVVELRARGMPLGLMASMTYEEVEARIEPGETLLLHSDGLMEAHGPGREMFGNRRMKQAMLDRGDGHGLIDHMLSALWDFTGHDWEQEDDITLVSLHRSAPASRAVSLMRELEDGPEERLASGT